MEFQRSVFKVLQREAGHPCSTQYSLFELSKYTTDINYINTCIVVYRYTVSCIPVTV